MAGKLKTIKPTVPISHPVASIYASSSITRARNEIILEFKKSFYTIIHH
jgi:hypothetical protein